MGSTGRSTPRLSRSSCVMTERGQGGGGMGHSSDSAMAHKNSTNEDVPWWVTKAA